MEQTGSRRGFIGKVATGAGLISQAQAQPAKPKPNIVYIQVIGFDEVLHPRTTAAANGAPLAVEFLNTRPSKPFFLDVGFFETQREYPEPTAEDDPRYT
jgi:hypothetical protein